jgi:beta-lactamase class A
MAPATRTSSSSRPKPLSPAQVRADAVAEIKRLTSNLAAGSYSIAAVNMSTGQSYTAGSTSGMWTASVYKLFLLEILMQRQGGPLTGSEATEAVPMIENSDNVAGYQEFIYAGNRPGMESGLADLGLTDTVAGHADPAFTITSATDCLTLLKNLVEPGRLTASARSYALNLMEQVEADQRWGVGVDADAGTDFANKNGWLSIDNDNAPGEDDDGLWAVNSVGVIRIDGQQVLMAVLTRHRPDFDSGVHLVEALARAMKPLVSSSA